jgi:hypothetical protein
MYLAFVWGDRHTSLAPLSWLTWACWQADKQQGYCNRWCHHGKIWTEWLMPSEQGQVTQSIYGKNAPPRPLSHSVCWRWHMPELRCSSAFWDYWSIYIYNSYDGLWWYLNHGVNYLHTASNGSFNLPAAKPWEMFHLYPSQHYEDSQVPLVFFLNR